MNVIEFKRGLDKLEAIYPPLTDEQRDLYFERLRLLSEDLYNKSIGYVLDTYKDKGFPKPADILEAATKVGMEGFPGLPEATGIKCSTCKDIGYILTEHKDAQPSVRPCECERGKKIKQGWIDRFNKGKKQ